MELPEPGVIPGNRIRERDPALAEAGRAGVSLPLALWSPTWSFSSLLEGPGERGLEANAGLIGQVGRLYRCLGFLLWGDSGLLHASASVLTHAFGMTRS